LVVIETEKVTFELPAPVSGVVTRILKQKGEAAAVGEVIGYMEAGDAAEETPKPAAEKAAQEKSAKGDKQTGRRGDEETRRQGDRETRR
jgi:2-oxoglutarate dehydrogenase E2 component (dihydrolipoamide succinyltransferase)